MMMSALMVPLAKSVAAEVVTVTFVMMTVSDAAILVALGSAVVALVALGSVPVLLVLLSSVVPVVALNSGAVTQVELSFLAVLVVALCSVAIVPVMLCSVAVDRVAVAYLYSTPGKTVTETRKMQKHSRHSIEEMTWKLL